MARTNEAKAQEVEEAPIHGDVLQAIISHVPLIDLVGALEVSTSWNRAVSSYHHSSNYMSKPWLILHSQTTRSPYATTTHAYDPRSNIWIEISQPSIKYVSSLMSSHSNFLYMLSISQFSFSFDPLNLNWHHVDAPLIWRVDPVVAKVGDHSIVVAGGTCDFENNPLAVEVFNINTGVWRTCESMPYLLKESAASTWLSIASTANKLLLVMEKSSGVLYSFNVETDQWFGPHDFRPDEDCFLTLIGTVGDRLIMLGLIGDNDEVVKVKIWEMELQNFSCKEKGEMPLELIGKLRSETFGFSSIQICSERGIVYIYNLAELQEVVVCELLEEGGGGGSGSSSCSWGSVRNPVVSGNGGIMKVAFTCAEVTIAELQRAKQNSKVMEITSIP